MKRVAHVVVAGELGGAEHMLRSLASAPGSPSTHDVFVLSPDEALPRFFREAGIAVHDGGRVREDPISFVRRSLGRKTVDWLATAIERSRANVVHLHTFGSQVVGTRAAMRVGAKIVRTEHSTRVYDDPSCWPFSRWSLVRAHAGVAISEHVRSVAIQKAPFAAARMRVVYNGVDTERFAPSAHAPSRDGVFTFATVGRLEPRKGFDVALRALAKVPEARLEIVGDGNERAALVALAGELGLDRRVTFHGYLADPRPVLAGAHAALASSRKEGLGIAFLEAMATGLPLVAVPHGGLVEIVKPGATGLLAADATPEALASVMRELASDPDRARSLGAAARADVIERFSLAAMRAGYDAVYASL